MNTRVRVRVVAIQIGRIRPMTATIQIVTIAVEIISCGRIYFVLSHLQGSTHSGRRVSVDSGRKSFAVRSHGRAHLVISGRQANRIDFKRCIIVLLRDRHMGYWSRLGRWISIRVVFDRRIVQTVVLCVHREVGAHTILHKVSTRVHVVHELSVVIEVASYVREKSVVGLVVGLFFVVVVFAYHS